MHNEPDPAWARLHALSEQAVELDALVVDYNPGGAVVEIGGVRGLLPLSQLNAWRNMGVQYTPDMAELAVQLLRQLMGRRLRTRIISINWRRNRLVLAETEPPGARPCPRDATAEGL
jgi:ribosomal protein S1